MKTRITERVDVGDFGIPSVLSSCHPISREARVEHTCEVMSRWVTRALEPLAREVLDFERLIEHTECSVDVCHMQNT